MSITISKHAKERYAERIMDRDNKTDVAVFLRDHDDKIQNDIEKMLEYGTILYEGQSFKDPKKTVGVTLSGSWVLIWDTREFVVITLYCIDLGVGDEVNQAFIKNAVEQIQEAKTQYEDTVKRTLDCTSTYQSLIEGNEAAIARYKKLIRDLESQNAGARQMISAITTDKQMADDNVRDKVEILIGRQRF